MTAETTEVLKGDKPQPQKTPFDFLAEIPGAPSKEIVLAWKAQVPNSRVRLVAPEGGTGRVYIMRAVGALEYDQLLGRIPANANERAVAEEERRQVASTCCLWTNSISGNKLTPEALQAGAAGTAAMLYTVVMELSDFVEPARLELLSIDL